MTLEINVSPRKEFGHWRPQTGFFAFGRITSMDASVVFKEDGIRTLILDNANSGIPDEIGYLEIEEKEFTILSEFGICNWNAALYHESVFTFDRWHLTAGIRFDYEGGLMNYDSSAALNYRLSPIMDSYRPFSLRYNGAEPNSSVQILPKLAALYTFPVEGLTLSAYGNIAKGFRAGGFNTQIFSDILQGKMMDGLMEDLGVYFADPGKRVTAGHTKYGSEEAWNLESGMRIRSGSRYRGDVSAYLISCTGQQLTVFPPGKNNGRMMTNAGRSRNIGVETEHDLREGGFHSHLSYSLCDARFLEGKQIPYVPLHSVFMLLEHRFVLSRDRTLTAGADVRAAGPVYWNEDNSRKSGMNFCPGAFARLAVGHVEIFLRGENLAGRQHPEFYFKSVGNEFFAVSKPLRLTLGITYKNN